MKEYMIEQMAYYLDHAGYDGNRWFPVKMYIYREVLGLDPTTKRGKKDLASMDLSKIREYAALMSDEGLVDCFGIICRRFSICM